ncbi:hypothetical protein EVAR_9287_1 [Eumeta japonica]|uniref:Uncharacterized protein n=1 Tax=Eumeta variegata TaxID=151549 RepID=A0A4C1TLP9_EUMVA|nr:hypothetical protein EVAR_9287_1 [Eumeta japonica]
MRMNALAGYINATTLVSAPEPARAAAYCGPLQVSQRTAGRVIIRKFMRADPWGSESKSFISHLGKRFRNEGGGLRSGSYLFQTPFVAIQRGNTASVMGTLSHGQTWIAGAGRPGTRRDHYRYRNRARGSKTPFCPLLIALRTKANDWPEVIPGGRGSALSIQSAQARAPKRNVHSRYENL